MQHTPAVVAVRARAWSRDPVDRLWDTARKMGWWQRGLLGHGGEGSVYLVEERETKRFLVAKYMREARRMRGHVKEMWILSRELTPQPFLVSYEGCIVDEPSRDAMLFMQHCDGNSLANLLMNFCSLHRYIPEPFLWHVFHEVAVALSYIHREGVIHRDIKPDNILLCWNDPHWGRRWRCHDYPRIKIADFGLAGVIGDASYKHIDYAGTPGYQPPEIPISHSEGDIWALGASIHELMTFKVPLPKGHHKWNRAAKQLCSPKNHKPQPYLYRKLFYSYTLHQFVERTLAWDMRDRPDAEKLIRHIANEDTYLRKDRFQPLPDWATHFHRSQD